MYVCMNNMCIYIYIHTCVYIYIYIEGCTHLFAYEPLYLSICLSALATGINLYTEFTVNNSIYGIEGQHIRGVSPDGLRASPAVWFP